MKYILLLLTGLVISGTGICQKQGWANKDTIQRQIDFLNKYLNSLNDCVLDTVLNDFLNGKFHENNTDLNRILYDRINADTGKINKNIDSIKSSFFYPKKLGDTASYSYLFYFTNKELRDYITSLTILNSEMSALVHKEDSSFLMNAFNDNHFLNAYHYMSICRSLLLSRLDNLIPQQEINDLQLLMAERYIPYYSKDTVKFVNPKHINRDRIGSAQDVALRYERRSWWWKVLVGGAIGGLIGAWAGHSR